jgi:hypothetical protein
LTVSGTETTGDDSDARSYVYTYINRYGEESAPSPPSRQLTIKDGATVQVSGFAAPPEGWGIVGIVLYRSVTGSRMEEDLKNQTLITSYFVVWTGAWTSEVTDAVLTRHLGAILYTDEVRVPPEGLRHIQHLNGTGFLIGATANQVHFSEEYMPWSWPDKYDLSFPSHIVNMVSVDATIFVSTDGRPYVIDASSACDPEKRNVIRDADTPLPDVACGQPRSAVATPFGMIYNSADGLVLFKTDASWQLITTPWFSPTEWRRHKLDATRLAFWQGKIICAMDDICYVLELDAENYRTSDIGHLSTISDKPSDMMVSSNGELLMLEDNVVWQFDASENLRNFFWRSAAFDVDGDVSLTTLKVKSEGVLATIETPYPDVRYSRYVSDDKPVRIKRLGRHGEYRLTLEGRHPVEYAELGTAVMTVSKGI